MSAQVAAALEIVGLHVQRGQGTQAFHVELEHLILAPGQAIALVGRSGCGKSTLLESLGLLLAPTRLEHFMLDGLDVRGALLKQDGAFLAHMRALKLGFVLQNGGLLPYLNVQENIELPRHLLGLSAQSAIVDEAIDVLQLRPLLKLLPSALSIGERQRVACVRALAHTPKVILADEPTAALDPSTAHNFFTLLLSLIQRLQLAAIVVSHDWVLLQEFGLPRYEAQLLEKGSRFVHRS